MRSELAPQTRSGARSRRIDFVTWDGSGNEPPAIGLAQELAGRGHRIRFVGFESQRQRLMAYGFELAPLTRAAALVAQAPADQRIRAVVAEVWTGESLGSELAELLSGDPPDLVVVDCLMFSAMDTVRRLGTPAASLFHSSPAAFVSMAEGPGPFGTDLVAAIDRSRAAEGLPPTTDGWDLWAGWPTIVASIPELDPEGVPTPASFFYAGPLAPSNAPATPVQLPAGDDPLVLTSQSGAAFGQALDRLQTIADAMASLPVRLLITSALAAEPGALRLAPNSAVVARADHRALMPAVSLCINQAGHGTLSAALEAGVPVLAMPAPMADQPYLAERVAELGAGRHLDRDAGAGDIRAAVAEMLGNPRHREVAGRLRQSIAALPGSAGAADWLESRLEAGS